MNKIIRGVLMLLFASLSLIGCSGSDGGGAANFTGKFVDATVEGLGYKCGPSTVLSGSTTATGEFTCPAGQAVAFYVGDIQIGSVASPTAVVTPLDLVGANATPGNAKVMNIVRFLMSISSTNPTSGKLTIDPAVVAAAAGKTIDFATATNGLDTLITTIRSGATVYTNAQATSHVTASVNGLFAGNYSGTYSGTASGTWSITIDANGAVTGSVDGVAGTITGNMATTLSTGSTYGFTGTGNGTAWGGTLNISSKVFSGTWNGTSGGTFTGSASSPPVAANPTIASFTPATGAVGTSVNVTGTNLMSVTQVLFTGPAPSTSFVTGTLVSKASTLITTAIPTGLAAGSYTVSAVYPGGEVAAAGAFTVTPSGGGGSTTPTITGYSPATGAVGTTVTITGTNLGLGFPPAPIVKFGTTATSAPVLTGQTSLTVPVPAGLAAGAYAITIGGLSGTPMTVGTFNVTSAGGGGASGLTFSPAFNGTSTIANSAPIVAGSIFLYAQNNYQQQFSVTYTPVSGSTPEGLTITATSVVNSTAQVALVNQVTSANNLSPTCVLTAHALLPTCANAGITFNKGTGNISFTNTPMAINTGSTAPQSTAFTVNGTLTFPPF